MIIIGETCTIIFDRITKIIKIKENALICLIRKLSRKITTTRTKMLSDNQSKTSGIKLIYRRGGKNHPHTRGIVKPIRICRTLLNWTFAGCRRNFRSTLVLSKKKKKKHPSQNYRRDVMRFAIGFLRL